MIKNKLRSRINSRGKNDCWGEKFWKASFMDMRSHHL